jgi:hypothetical protein
VPSLCETTASRRICALNERITAGVRAVNAPDHVAPVSDAEPAAA